MTSSIETKSDVVVIGRDVYVNPTDHANYTLCIVVSDYTDCTDSKHYSMCMHHSMCVHGSMCIHHSICDDYMACREGRGTHPWPSGLEDPDTH